jgi:16S rRNA (uracil1498-N3)-methyltransferase
VSPLCFSVIQIPMNVFYCPTITGNEAVLSPGESAHCIRVLRLSKGDNIMLIDGRGGLFEACITVPDPKQCTMEILRSVDHGKNRNFSLHIAIAPTKNIDRFEWFVEKAVEIGIDTITPLLCQRSERRILKTDRLHKLVLSTMKQAVVPYQPVINELTDLRTFLTTNNNHPGYHFIAHCAETERKSLKSAVITGSDVIVLIGPEGDFSPEEIKLASDNNFIPVTLGPNRLRTETAGVVACHTVTLLNEK